MGISIVLASLLRNDLQLPAKGTAGLFGFAGVAALIFVGCGAARGLYAGRWHFSSFEEVSGLVGAAVTASAILFVVNLAIRRPVPASVPLIATSLVLCLTAGLRYLWRVGYERGLLPSGAEVERLVIIGAGEGGQQIITAMLRNPSGRFLPVALIDDDPLKRNLRIRSIHVSGSRHDLGAVAERTEATVALLAVPSADSALVRDYADLAKAVGLRLMVLPSSNELLGDQIDTDDIRPVTHADLLGRHEVDTDINEIADYITGKRVLVTGAGGSIGSELSRQLNRFAPASLVLLDRDESALHAVQLSIEGRAMLDNRNLVVADLRDQGRIDQVLGEHHPEVVFHAAALKHLPLLEMHPGEAVKTNVWGTHHLVEAALAHGTERFVNISTDKAANPISVLGYTKRLAERVTSAATNRGDGVFLSVRFGNVLGSRGSVLTTFKAQIQAGGPVTVTHREVTRYFMTVEEAVQLVIQAGALGQDGEVLVLDMGEPVLIDDVARRLIAESDRPIEIIYTGLRQGEKLHEVLLSDTETGRRRSHPQISHVDVPAIETESLPVADAALTDAAMIDSLRSACQVDLQRAHSG